MLFILSGLWSAPVLTLVGIKADFGRMQHSSCTASTTKHW